MSPRKTARCARCSRRLARPLTIVNQKTGEKLRLGRSCALTIIKGLRPRARRGVLVAVVGQGS